MLMIERRKELGYSIDKVSRQTGIPRSVLLRIEQGLVSLKLLPFYQSLPLIRFLDIDPDIWYNYIMSDVYQEWVKHRIIERWH